MTSQQWVAKWATRHYLNRLWSRTKRKIVLENKRIEIPSFDYKSLKCTFKVPIFLFLSKTFSVNSKKRYIDICMLQIILFVNYSRWNIACNTWNIFSFSLLLHHFLGWIVYRYYGKCVYIDAMSAKFLLLFCSPRCLQIPDNSKGSMCPCLKTFHYFRKR